MTKTIDTLVEDIHYILDHTEEHDPDSTLAAKYSDRIGTEFTKATLKRDRPREKGKLWASDLGKPCMRQHWYNFNMPEAAEKLSGSAKFKFLYGNILEEAVLYMAEEAGHTVEYTQEPVKTTIDGWEISGRIDAIVDGVLIDVKSTSSYGYTKYKDGIVETNDSFGYLWQLGYYKQHLAVGKPTRDQGFIWIDKQNGHIAYTPCDVPTAEDIKERAKNIIHSVEQRSAEDVDRGYISRPYGKSGNEELCIECSYCLYKKECWKDANNGSGIRTFAYSHKPVHFVKITREPNVPELTGKD